MDVSSIAEQLLFTTVRIETFNPSNNSNLVGTGFFFSYERGDATQKTIVQFIVTNKHVVENGITGRLSFLKGDKENKPKLGERIIFNFDKNFRDLWYFNSDKKIDVAILPLNDLLHFLALKGESVFYRAVSSEMIPKNESLKDIDALEEVIFIGYPYGLWDKKNFLPVFRKGITASPIIHDFEDQKIFLIDASVFPGSSGSPVFIFNQGAYNPKSGGIHMGTRLLFLGILSDVLERQIEGKIEYRTEKIKYHTGEEEIIIPVPIINRLLNIGIVFKYSTIIGTIEEFLPHYQEWRKSASKIF